MDLDRLGPLRVGPREAEKRLRWLAKESLGNDGYDTGSMDFDLDRLVDHVDDPSWKQALRLRHAYLAYATWPRDERRREGLRHALATAAEGVEVTAIREQCARASGSWLDAPLPATPDEVPSDGGA